MPPATIDDIRTLAEKANAIRDIQSLGGRFQFVEILDLVRSLAPAHLPADPVGNFAQLAQSFQIQQVTFPPLHPADLNYHRRISGRV